MLGEHFNTLIKPEDVEKNRNRILDMIEEKRVNLPANPNLNFISRALDSIVQEKAGWPNA